MDVRKIRIEDFDYPLPAERIAKFPVKERDQSQLLILKDGVLRKDRFFNLPEMLPKGAALVFNETRVFQARLLFHKETGARIEVFLLEPASEQKDMQIAFAQRGTAEWKCFVGNSKKWKGQELELKLENGGSLFARKVKADGNSWIVAFRWEPVAMTFSEVIDACGNVPLPPYIHREAVEADKQSYQTVYAREEGSVAAPTAGLHFTPDVFQKLKSKNIRDYRLTLHVGAGTFKPVDSEEIGDHEMHREQIVVPKSVIRALSAEETIIPVGTTSVRTLESLYWFAMQLSNNKEINYPFLIEQWEPYEGKEKLSRKKAFEMLLNYMEKNNLENLRGATRLMIVPSYRYHLVDALVTNFHQPKSTLLLLVSALIGDQWKKAYQFALENDFRFLSYGDSCLFFGH